MALREYKRNWKRKKFGFLPRGIERSCVGCGKSIVTRDRRHKVCRDCSKEADKIRRREQARVQRGSIQRRASPNPHPAFKAFCFHKDNARRRGISFLLSFEEWLSIWEKSGKLQLRGRGGNKYVMARFKDNGPYAVGNVKIITFRENAQESNKWL